ncbi:MAG: adenylosuccinate synthase [Bacteroidales bacterium]|nr:adenylosuccinate synthase [Bacteroidales bacterium]MCF8456791.1 adenylosuccinate synthase [Bacteroidales bacterium]
MKVDVLLGLQWGDEGKGKIVDVLTPKYDVIARFQGGPNAGHSLEFNEIKHVLHTIPSGIFHPDKKNVIGNGVVIDPVIFKKEVEEVTKLGVDLTKNLLISKKAHLILPSHRALDAASEAAKGNSKIGSTLKGIGPTYMDKTGRNGLRVGDTLSPNFMEKYKQLKEKHNSLLGMYDFKPEISDYEKQWFEGVEFLKSFTIIDSEYAINNYLAEGKAVLAEGAQGTLLDIDFGSYPFVTSSNTICAGACTGLGVAPNRIGEVFGIFKAYCTRVGSGPFPTELSDDTGAKLQKCGHEFGATTGRPRRCGWLDMVALKYSVMINGVTSLIMTKADVLDTFDTIKVCVAYNQDGKMTELFPFDTEAKFDPVYLEFDGWNIDTTKLRHQNEFPEELNAYINFIEEELGIPVQYVSVGPDREQIIELGEE